MIDFDTWWNSAAADEFRAQHEDMDGNAFRPVWDAAIQAAQQQAEPVGDERKAFETWAQSKNMHLAKGNCGWYISAPTHEAWQGWQACAAQSAQSCQRAGVAECKWSPDGDTDTGIWDSSCGESWVFTDLLSPGENGVKFCHGCGGRVVIAAAPTQQQEGE